MRIGMAAIALIVLGGGSLDKPKPAQLEGTAWSGVSTSGPESGMLNGGPSAFAIEFGKDNAVRVKLPCNTAGGGYVATLRSKAGGDLRFEGFRVTRSICPEIAAERAVLAQLGRVRSYAIDGGKLVLSLDGGGTMTWGD